MTRRPAPRSPRPAARPGARHAAPAAPRAEAAGRALAVGRTAREGVALAWARDRDGRLAPAAALDAASRRARAPFACPGCGDEVIPHLGARRARHFAHRPGSACPLTSPETALHFNAKARLLALCGEAFSGARRVTLLTRCAACRRTDPRDLAALGDEAVNEGAVGALRADVLVRRAGAAALALEVLVTHAVDAAKEAALAAAGVPAVEIDAREAWEREVPGTGGAGGAVPGIVPAIEVVCDRTLGFEPCADCRALARADADRRKGGEAAEVAELEAYRARGLLRNLENLLESQGLVTAPPAQTGTAGPVPGTLRAALSARFRCPDCGGASLLWGQRLARHACPGQPPRAVAWGAYDGGLVVLGWWKR